MSVLGIALIFWTRTDKGLITMNEIDLSLAEDTIIGSELPRLLYADEDKAVFDCAGIYVYDFSSKKISHALDTLSFGEMYFSKGKDRDIRSGQFVLQNGDEIIISYNDYGNLNTDDLPKHYSYALSHQVLKEINIEEYEDQRFECQYLEYEDDLYAISTGMVANINDDEFVYLKHSEYKVSSIKIVYVNGMTETVYDVFYYGVK